MKKEIRNLIRLIEAQAKLLTYEYGVRKPKYLTRIVDKKDQFIKDAKKLIEVARAQK